MGLVVLGIALVIFAISIVLLTYLFRQETPSFALGDKVGVCEVTGVISDSREILRGLKSLVEDGGVKAIVIRIDSPGGGVGAAQEIYREIVKSRKVKKVVASLGGVAASGGYYVACGADRIVANPGTITGSIGVVMQFANLEELLGKIGYKGYVVKSGTYKDIGSPFREMTQKERVLLQEVIDTVHRQFVDTVVESRNLLRDDVEAVADGRILSGEQALNLGLVDQLGNFEDSVVLAADLGGIKGKPRIVHAPKRRPSVFDVFMENALQRLTGLAKDPHVRLDYLWYR